MVMAVSRRVTCEPPRRRAEAGPPPAGRPHPHLESMNINVRSPDKFTRPVQGGDGGAIDSGVEIRLSDKPVGIRHLHLRDLRVAHRKDHVAPQRKRSRSRRGRWEPFHLDSTEFSSPRLALMTTRRPPGPSSSACDETVGHLGNVGPRP